MGADENETKVISNNDDEALIKMYFKELILDWNFIGRKIPPEIGSLSELGTLSLSSNMFNGSLQLSLSQLTKLETFDLENNFLSSDIPDGIGKLLNLSTLSLSMNKLSGGIPWSIQNLKNLQILELQNNGLSGEIPTWLFGLQTLQKRRPQPLRLQRRRRDSQPLSKDFGKIYSD